jgi:hypothetical protein
MLVNCPQTVVVLSHAAVPPSVSTPLLDMIPHTREELAPISGCRRGRRSAVLDFTKQELLCPAAR